MKRYGSVIALKPEHKEAYLQEHANVWPEVNAMITACSIRNFSIFMRQLPDGKDYLFMYYEYHGSDYDTDMAKMAADPVTQEWWDLVKPYQEPLENRDEGEWWAAMCEVCHHD